jgi:tRNA pseudouridine32 synthase/23S rRNA pseudouridine746 synthase
VGVVHEDAWCLIVDKPSGLLCVPGRGADKQDCLARRIQTVYPKVLIVHRLDMATSGLCLMALGPATQRALGIAFAQRQVRKRYVAVVAGRIGPPDTADGWGVIDLPLAADWPNRPRQVVDRERGKPSITRWRLLGHEGGASRLELEPLTGRTHQLRVHLQALGHPILGDSLYAPPPTREAAARLLLHATELGFAHPGTAAAITVLSDAPF